MKIRLLKKLNYKKKKKKDMLSCKKRDVILGAWNVIIATGLMLMRSAIIGTVLKIMNVTKIKRIRNLPVIINRCVSL